MYALSVLYLAMHCTIIPSIVAVLLYFVQFFRVNIQFQESPYPELFVGDASLGRLSYARKVDLFVIFHVIGHCSLVFYIPYDAYSVILPYCYVTIF